MSQLTCRGVTVRKSSLDERSDSPWDNCWHIALTESAPLSLKGDDSGIGLTAKCTHRMKKFETAK